MSGGGRICSAHSFAASLALVRLDDRHDVGLAQRVLQHDVVHRIPVGHGDAPAAEIGEFADAGVTADHQAGAVGMAPGQDLHRELVVVAHPHRHRLEQVHEVELSGREAFGQRRPAAHQGRRLDLEAALFEIAVGMRDEQRARVGDRQIADAHDISRSAPARR